MNVMVKERALMKKINARIAMVKKLQRKRKFSKYRLTRELPMERSMFSMVKLMNSLVLSLVTL